MWPFRMTPIKETHTKEKMLLKYPSLFQHKQSIRKPYDTIFRVRGKHLGRRQVETRKYAKMEYSS